MSWGDASTPLGCLPAPGVIDQDLPDGACADGEEVCAALPGNVSRTEQLELHLVNQFGGLKRMAHLFAGERNARSCPELIVHEREEAVDGGLIPCLLEEACHLSRVALRVGSRHGLLRVAEDRLRTTGIYGIFHAVRAVFRVDSGLRSGCEVCAGWRGAC
jgi:hypothetical protein